MCHQTAGEGLLTIPELFRDIQWVARRGRCSRVPLEDTLRSVFANPSVCGLSKQRRDSSVRDHDWCDGFRGEIIQKVISHLRDKSLRAKLTQGAGREEGTQVEPNSSPKADTLHRGTLVKSRNLSNSLVSRDSQARSAGRGEGDTS